MVEPFIEETSSIERNIISMSNFNNFEDNLSLSSTLFTNVRTKLFEFNGKTIVGFQVGTKHMICLPQLYDYFLKEHVGGLHTVYTKLKRLNIHPIICNVDQVKFFKFLFLVITVNKLKIFIRYEH